MAIYINSDDCINCGACEPECPNNAIYEGGSVWTLGENQYEDSTSPVRINMKIQLHREASKVIFGNRTFISSFRTNARNARHFMMNLNARRFALLIVVCPMQTM